MPFFHELRRAILDRNTNSVDAILRNGVSANQRIGDSGVTPLNLAIYSGNLEIVQRLLKYGADPNQTSVCQDSERGEEEYPIMPAARQRNKKATQLLLEYGADVNLTDSVHLSALYYAVNCGHLQVTKLLIEHGAQFGTSRPNRQGITPLHAAVKKGHLEISQLLCDNGANVNEQDYRLNSPLHFAGDGSLNCVAYLIENEAKLNCPNCDHQTPLMVAITTKQWDLAVLLLQHGADAAILDINNKSCMDHVTLIILHDLSSSRHRTENFHRLVATLWQAGGVVTRPYLISALQNSDEANRDSLSSVLSILSQPKPLRLRCCQAIRHQLSVISNGTDIVPLVHKLPIPTYLKSLLCFKDFNSNISL